MDCAGTMEITLTDASGNAAGSFHFTGMTPGIQTGSIDVHTLSPGIYFLCFYVNGDMELIRNILISG
jgi:hypothetical protein